MTDRELLELAAKAAGVGLISWTNMYDACDEIGGRFITQPRGEPWNPLADDGDALRLAVKTGEPFVVRTRCVTTISGLVEDFDPAVSGDDLRATRRAIVRAAAEIGKALQQEHRRTTP